MKGSYGAPQCPIYFFQLSVNSNLIFFTLKLNFVISALFLPAISFSLLCISFSTIYIQPVLAGQAQWFAELMGVG